jgi:hypothetical protein
LPAPISVGIVSAQVERVRERRRAARVAREARAKDISASVPTFTSYDATPPSMVGAPM